MGSFQNYLCDNIRCIRKKYSMTQKEMAEILGISVEKLRKIENNDPTVRMGTNLLCRFCEHFALTADAALRERLE